MKDLMSIINHSKMLNHQIILVLVLLVKKKKVLY